jgi:ABC-type sugar transport system substrate-binding protein
MSSLSTAIARVTSRRAALRLMALGGGAALVAACTQAAPSAPAATAPAAASTPAAGPTSVTSGLQPFQPSDKLGSKPNLPKRVAWANTSDAEFFLSITSSMEAAAKARGLEFLTAIANDDSAKNIEQINTFLERGIGALAIQPLDANAQAPLMQRAIDQGIAVLSLVTPSSWRRPTSRPCSATARRCSASGATTTSRRRSSSWPRRGPSSSPARALWSTVVGPSGKWSEGSV